MRLAAALVLAVVHLLQAGWILQGGADLLFPRSGTVKAGETRCCNSGCGCPTEAQQRRSCCCFPQREAPAAEPVQVPIRCFEEDPCRGVRGAEAYQSFFCRETGPDGSLVKVAGGVCPCSAAGNAGRLHATRTEPGPQGTSVVLCRGRRQTP